MPLPNGPHDIYEYTGSRPHIRVRASASTKGNAQPELHWRITGIFPANDELLLRAAAYSQKGDTNEEAPGVPNPGWSCQRESNPHPSITKRPLCLLSYDSL